MRALLLLGCLAVNVAADAATFTVTNGSASGTGSLRQAVLDANATEGDPHLIEILPSADPIVLTQPLPELRRSLSITAQVRTRVITPRAGFILAYREIGGTLNLTNLDVIADENSAATASMGGCISVFDPRPGPLPWTISLTNVELTNCTAASVAGSPAGGAIYVDGILTLENSTIRAASITGSGNGQGAAIYQRRGTLTLRRSRILFNGGPGARQGIVYLANGSNLDAQDTEFAHNQLRASDSGGVIYAAAGGVISLSRVAFADNYADQGTALTAFNSEVRIENTSFYRNASSPTALFPTAVAVDGGTLAMRHNAFFDNTNHFAQLSGTIRGFSGNVFGPSRGGLCALQAMPAGAIANFGGGGCTAAGFASSDVRIAGYGRVSSTDPVPLLTFAAGSPIFDAYGPTAGQSATDFNRCAQVDARSNPRPRDDDGNGFSQCDAGPGESAQAVPMFRDGFE